MKVIRCAPDRLDVVNSSYWWTVLFAFLGIGLFGQELWKFFQGKQDWHDLHADIPILLSIPFTLIGIFLCQRYRVTFDKGKMEMRWTLSSPFQNKSRSVPLSKVHNADYEIDANQFVNDHPKWGPKKRLVVRTEEGNFPMAGLYTYGSDATDRAVAAINKFLGHK